MVQDRVNEHLLFYKRSSPQQKKAAMNLQNERSPLSQFEPQYALHGIAPASVKAPSASSAADRLYQLAALIAGIFLLASLL
jgi:hypothetical protein